MRKLRGKVCRSFCRGRLSVPRVLSRRSQDSMILDRAGIVNNFDVPWICLTVFLTAWALRFHCVFATNNWRQYNDHLGASLTAENASES